MPVESIHQDALAAALQGGAASPQLRAWCEALEAGSVLYFPRTPVPIPEANIEFLLGRQQTGSRLHKNISYKPDVDSLGGIDKRDTPASVLDQLHSVMRRYSADVANFLTGFLSPYEGQWRRDYASYRPIEEKGRDLPLRRRNDLLHVDAFPTRPTRGKRILRFFHNIHPDRTREWAIGEPFPKIVVHFAPSRLPLPHPEGTIARAAKKMAASTGLGRLVPQWKRTPYDEFMMRLHNTMKEDAEFQRACAKEFVEFPPGSSWMVYTETVPHAVFAGQYALEQTLLVDPAALVMPQSAPLAVLENMVGARLDEGGK